MGLFIPCGPFELSLRWAYKYDFRRLRRLDGRNLKSFYVVDEFSCKSGDCGIHRRTQWICAAFLSCIQGVLDITRPWYKYSTESKRQQRLAIVTIFALVCSSIFILIMLILALSKPLAIFDTVRGPFQNDNFVISFNAFIELVLMHPSSLRPLLADCPRRRVRLH